MTTRKIILLMDPPSYDAHDNTSSRSYNTEYAERLQNMYNFILSFQCPVVMILSDVSGRDDFQFAAERCLPQRIKQRYIVRLCVCCVVLFYMCMGAWLSLCCCGSLYLYSLLFQSSLLLLGKH